MSSHHPRRAHSRRRSCHCARMLRRPSSLHRDLQGALDLFDLSSAERRTMVLARLREVSARRNVIMERITGEADPSEIE